MILDKLTQVSTAQAITATALSTDSIPTNGRDMGMGEELFFFVNIDTTFTAAGAATMIIQVVTSASANLASPTIIGLTPSMPLASLVAGAQFAIPIPRGSVQAYLGLQYAVTTGPMTAGAVTAGIAHDVQSNRNYPSGFNVL